MVLDEQRSTSNERTENAGSFGEAPADSRQKPVYGTPAYDIPPLQPESGVPVDPSLSSDATDPESLGTYIVNESGPDAGSSATPAPLPQAPIAVYGNYAAAAPPFQPLYPPQPSQPLYPLGTAGHSAGGYMPPPGYMPPAPILPPSPNYGNYGSYPQPGPPPGMLMVPTTQPDQSTRTAAIIVEVILDLFGIYGVGWLIAGETTTGILLLVGSFIWWAVASIGVLFTAGIGLICVLPLNIVFLLLSVILLSQRTAPRTYPN